MRVEFVGQGSGHAVPVTGRKQGVAFAVDDLVAVADADGWRVCGGLCQGGSSWWGLIGQSGPALSGGGRVGLLVDGLAVATDIGLHTLV